MPALRVIVLAAYTAAASASDSKTFPLANCQGTASSTSTINSFTVLGKKICSEVNVDSGGIEHIEQSFDCTTGKIVQKICMAAGCATCSSQVQISFTANQIPSENGCFGATVADSTNDMADTGASSIQITGLADDYFVCPAYTNSEEIAKAASDLAEAAVGLGTGILVAVIVAPIVGLILLIVCIVCCCKHCNSSKPAVKA